MQKKKRLGNESLYWIKETNNQTLETVDKRKASKSEKLNILKQYVNKEKEENKIKPVKAKIPISDKSATIVKKKGGITSEEKTVKEIKDQNVTIIEEEPSVSEKEKAKEIETVIEKDTITNENEKINKSETEEKENSYDKLKSKKSDIIGAVKKEGSKVAETLTKPISSINKQNGKNILNSIISASIHPVKVISSIDKKITVSMRNINLSEDNNMIDIHIVKPIKEMDNKINSAIKKFLDSIL